MSINVCLSDKNCIPCEGNVLPLSLESATQLLTKVDNEWKLNNIGHIDRTFKFANFMQAMTFANKITEIAEFEGHHPDLYISWGVCKVEIWTHSINGLSENDFILASKIDKLAL